MAYGLLPNLWQKCTDVKRTLIGISLCGKRVSVCCSVWNLSAQTQQAESVIWLLNILNEGNPVFLTWRKSCFPFKINIMPIDSIVLCNFWLNRCAKCVMLPFQYGEKQCLCFVWYIQYSMFRLCWSMVLDAESRLASDKYKTNSIAFA